MKQKTIKSSQQFLEILTADAALKIKGGNTDRPKATKVHPKPKIQPDN